MASPYDDLYRQVTRSMDDLITQDQFFPDFLEAIRAGRNTFAMTRRLLVKQIDEDWVSVIENALVPLDNAIRHPRKFIKQEEEILPIELSHNITAESVRHLAQHTNLISKVEGDMVTPSKILNVYKEESLETYENKFLNTLIDRLYIFVNKRYAKLKEARDEDVRALSFSSAMQTPGGGSVSLRMEIETRDAAAGGQPLWERVEKLRGVVDAYKASSFVQSMNGLYIRPPVMRTNAILKDQDLKQCLLLWQYIESYANVGYRVLENEETQRPDEAYIGGLYELAALHYLLFRRQTAGAPETFRSQSKKPVSPKFVKSFEKRPVDTYNFHDVEFLKTVSFDPLHNRGKLSEDELRIRREVNLALATEKKRKADELAAAREAERLRLEKERQAVEKRLAAERAAEEKRFERERLEAERQRRAEEKQLAAEERRRAAEQRAEELARRREERERLLQEKERLLREKEELASQARVAAQLEEQAKKAQEAAGRLLEQRRARRVMRTSRRADDWHKGR